LKPCGGRIVLFRFWRKIRLCWSIWLLALERKLDGNMARAQLVNGSRFLLSLLRKQALYVFPARDKSWDDQTWQIAKNLREEVALNGSDPGMIWNPANPQYLLRNGCR
jgi:hypothetical protein